MERSNNDLYGQIGRSRSVDYEDPAQAHQRKVDEQIALLQREMMELKKKLIQFEDETNRNRWGIRYSRRMAIMSNLLLGLWIFWSHFLKFVQKQKRASLIDVFNPLKRHRNFSSVNTILIEAYIYAVSKSWIFFVGSLLLTRNVSWKRYFGLGLTTSYSLFLAISSSILPWTNYFNILSNLLFMTASWTHKEKSEAPTLSDFITPPPLTRIPSSSSNLNASPSQSVYRELAKSRFKSQSFDDESQ